MHEYIALHDGLRRKEDAPVASAGVLSQVPLLASVLIVELIFVRCTRSQYCRYASQLLLAGRMCRRARVHSLANRHEWDQAAHCLRSIDKLQGLGLGSSRLDLETPFLDVRKSIYPLR